MTQHADLAPAREQHDLSFLSGGGEMGARMRAYDWARSPLGVPERWPQALRTCVRIVLTSRQPMFVWWGDQLINLYNDAYKSIVGGKHPEALGQPASVVWREIWDQVGPRAALTMGGNEGTYDEALLLIMERNGYPEETYYTFSYSPVSNDLGGTGGIICANTDDTQRIIGQRQIALLRELAANTINTRTVEEACSEAARSLRVESRDLPFALVYLLDSDGKTLRLAGAAGAEPGALLSPESVTLGSDGAWPFSQACASGAPFSVVVLDEAHQAPRGAWPKRPQHAAVLPIAASGRAGAVGYLVAGLNPFRLLDDGYRGFLDLVVGQLAASIANAETYEEEKRRAEALAELDRAKTAFFSNVSHEFRTPLTLMLGPLEDALGAPARTLTGENLETTYRNAVRLLKLVNALLDFSRIEAGRAQASYEPTDLCALTRDLASAFRSAITRAGLTFDVECKELSGPVHVDHDMWEKIVLNLLSNALKFTFEGGISVRLREHEQRVELCVTDTGTGVPEAELPHLFERFHRVEGSRARTHEGSGIGLALVNELVKLHGGEVRVESKVGQGTAFYVSIPLGTAHLPRERIAAKRTLASTATGAAPYVQEALRWLPGEPTQISASALQHTHGEPVAHEVSGARILVADDNADMREYLVRLLHERFQVLPVSDGAQALEAARHHAPDLVLTDVMMPNLDGFGLLAALRSQPATSRLPVIMLSARAGEESRIEGLEAGADDYLPKPFSARELLARVTTHLQLARLRKQAEAEREKLLELFRQSPLPIAVIEGKELRYAVANPPYCQIVGQSELLGQSLRDAFPELGDHAFIATVEQVLAGGQSITVNELKVPLFRKGEVADAYFNYVAQPIRSDAGEVTAVLVVALEVSEQVKARKRVDALRSQAEDASRAKDEFLSTLSHELRTPLNAIVGWAQMLRTGSVPSVQRERALETVERNARLQARLIDDMLDLARIEQGKMVLSVGPVNVVKVVEGALDAVRPAADAKGVRLQPVLDSHATIVGDADRLQQIVWNLLTNAIKFTPKGGRIQVRLHREQSYVEVAVADNGQGIAREFLPHVFDRFRQADGSFARRAGGLGLGLAIVRSLVELHGGVVSAESDGEGKGATFVVKLPTAPLRSDNAARPEPVPEPGAPLAANFECPAVLKGLRVLVVDDEPDTRELLRYLLEQCECTVSTAGSAAEALAQLTSGVFDLLISDVGMPEEDGYSLLRKVRALSNPGSARVPALALTAYARADDRMQALKSGFNMHLAKPIDAKELLVVAATLIGAYSAQA